MSKGGDPFNFNDIYTQMGADNLVKKPMSEIKRPAATPAPSAKVQPPSPEQVRLTSKAYDLDFLAFGGAPKSAAPPPAPASSATTGGSSGRAPSLGLNELFPSAPASKPAPSSGAGATLSGADPFAAFETVDGAQPVVKSTPISGAATPSASSTNLLNLEGDSSAGDSGRYAAAAASPPQAAAPLSPYPAIPEAAPAPPRYTPSVHPSTPPAPASTINISNAAVQDSDSHPKGQGDALPAPQPSRTSHDGYPNSFHQDQPSNRGGMESASSSSNPAHARGITGFFTELRKKAVKAAQVGLQHLENALETKEPGASGKGWGSGHLAGSDSEEVLVTRPAVQYEAAAWAEPDDAGAAKALEVAVRIAELPMEVRSDALAQLKPELRTTVEEILREQVLLESEDRDAVAQQQMYPSIAASADVAPRQQQHYGTTAAGPPHPRPLTPAAPAPLERPLRQQQHAVAHEVADLLADDDLTSNRQPGNGAARTAQEADMDDFFAGSSAPEQQGRPSADDPAKKSSMSASGAVNNPSPAATHQLFGDFVSGADESGAGYAQPAAPDPDHGFGSFMSPGQPAAATAPPSPQQDAGDMGDFFRGGQTAAPASPTTRPATAVQPSQMDLIGDLHSEGVDVSTHQKLYEDVDSQEGEPEVRRQLRAARLAERNGKMRAALAEKLAQDEEEARRKEEQVQLKDQHKQVIDNWKGKHKTNIRGLLGSLHTVLWENSGWAPVTVGDLLESTQVKKVYMKANLLVHPDKVRQRNGTAEQVAIADMVFDVLKEAWNAFRP